MSNLRRSISAHLQAHQWKVNLKKSLYATAAHAGYTDDQINDAWDRSVRAWDVEQDFWAILTMVLQRRV